MTEIQANNLAITAANVQDMRVFVPALPTVADIMALTEMAKAVALSGFLKSNSSDIRQRVADAFFVMKYGHELGIPPMAALNTIYVLDGKPSTSGQAMLALLRKASIDIELPNPGRITDAATVRIRRPGGQWREYTYTVEMAKKAGLIGKKNWEKHRAEMLMWRAVSTSARFEAPDVILGLYTIEEIAPDLELDDQGTPINYLETVTVQGGDSPSESTSPRDVLNRTAPNRIDTTEPPPAPEWPSQPAVDELLKRIRTGLIPDITDGEIARLANISSVNDLSPSGWGKYSSRAAAATAVKSAFEYEAQNGKSNKQTSSVTKEDAPFTWNDFDEHAIEDWLHKYFVSLRLDNLGEEIGKPLREWKNPDALKQAVTNIAIAKKLQLRATGVKSYDGKAIVLDTVPEVRLYGRDSLRALGEHWKAHVDAWEAGKPVTLYCPVWVMSFEPGANGTYFMAKAVASEDIPF